MICETAPKLDIRKLDVTGLDYIEIGDFHVRIARTDCLPFGGKRAWFRCPHCFQRCAILYAWKHVGCRSCCNGRYRTELETPYNRRLVKAFKRRKRLGQTTGGILVPFPPKPKWMRWPTYMRLRGDALREEAEILERLSASIGNG